MAELNFTGDVDLIAAREGGALGADENILEVEFQFVFDMHGRLPDASRTDAPAIDTKNAGRFVTNPPALIKFISF